MVRIGQRLVWRTTVTTTRRSSTRSSDAYNAGLRIPARVQASTAQHRAFLSSSHQPSKADVRRMVYKTAKKNHVDPSLALAVAYHESGFQQRVVSPVDAIGVMQVLPSTGRVIARQYGHRLDLLKAQDNITAGVLLLQQLVRSTGSAEGALAGYYQGLGSVAARGLLPQTHAYIRNVTALRPRFRNG
jgi:soluble lytic murein transglycosylase-like protein